MNLDIRCKNKKRILDRWITDVWHRLERRICTHNCIILCKNVPLLPTNLLHVLLLQTKHLPIARRRWWLPRSGASLVDDDYSHDTCSLPSPSLPLRHPGRLAPFPGRSNVALHIVVSDLAAAATVSSSPALLDRAVDLLAGSKLVGLDLLAFFTSQAQHEAHED